MRIKGLIFGLFLVCCVCFNAAAQRGGEQEGVRDVEVFPQLEHTDLLCAVNYSPA